MVESRFGQLTVIVVNFRTEIDVNMCDSTADANENITVYSIRVKGVQFVVPSVTEEVLDTP